MKESGAGDEVDELLLRFRTRIEEETKSLINLGVPPESTEEVLMNRISISSSSTSESSGSTISEEDITKTIVHGRMRREEARRALIINREICKMESKGMDLTKALKKIIERVGHPRPTVIDELRKAQGAEVSFDENTTSMQKSVDEPKKASSSPLRLIRSSKAKKPLSFNTSKSTTASLKHTSHQPSTRKRSISNVLRSTPSADFKKKPAQSLKLNILRRKKQKK